MAGAGGGRPIGGTCTRLLLLLLVVVHPSSAFKGLLRLPLPRHAGALPGSRWRVVPGGLSQGQDRLGERGRPAASAEPQSLGPGGPSPLVPASTIKPPFRPDLGVVRKALLTKVLELNKGADFVKVTDDEMTLSAVQKMNEMNKDCCLVFSKEDPTKLEGIFTERDYVRRIMESQKKTSETPIVDVSKWG